MPLPPSVPRTTKDGVQITSSVDRCSYTIRELTRAALRDVGKFVCISSNRAAQKLYGGGLVKSRRIIGFKNKKTGNRTAFQYWARKKEGDLQVGITHDTWYGTEQELGSSRMKKKGILSNTVHDNVAEIVKIESQYLSALESEARALELISEEEYQGGGEE